MSYGLSDEMFGGGNNFTKFENYKLKNGEHKFRLLPPYAEGRLYAFVRLHWFSDETGNGRIPVKCPANKKSGAEEVCPICRKVKEMKDKAVNLKATNQFDAGKALDESADAWSAKATYLWQILDNEGNLKVLSLSYRAHEALSQKVGFFWKQKQINITDAERNYRVYCNRTGQKAQTNYAFEVLDGPQDIRKIEVPKLLELHTLYQDKPIAELEEMVVNGFVKSNKKKNDTGDIPSHKGSNNQEAQETPKSEGKSSPPPETSVGETNGAYQQFTADDIPF